MVSKECQMIKEMIKDEDKAVLEYATVIEMVEDKVPESIIDRLYEGMDDEDKHSDMFKEMGIIFKCDLEKEE